MADQYDEFEKLIAEGNFLAAEPRLFDWLQYHPNDARTWLLYGKCSSNPIQKRECFKRALDLDPSIVEAQELLNQLSVTTSAIRQTKEQSGASIPSVHVPSSFPAKIQPSSSILKSPVLDEQAKTKLSVVLYSFSHFLFTILLGGILIYVFSASVPGLLNINKPDDTIQRNWLSDSTPSDAAQELQGLSIIFLNPSRLDYRTINNYQELKSLQTSITTDSSVTKPVEFNGVRFNGQLVGGSILQSGKDGQPTVIVMNVVIDETRIPVVYYGPSGNFDYEDMIMIEGVYIEEPNGVVAQRVERLSTSSSTQVDSDALFMLRVAGGVLLWALVCFSVFFWRLNLKRWRQEYMALRSPMAVVFLLLIFSMAVTGCTIDLFTTLRPDGTGITSILVRESRENMDFLRSAPGVPGYLSAVVRDVKNSGAMFEQYVEGDQDVFLIQRYFNNSSPEMGDTYPIEGSWISIQRYSEKNEEVIRFLGVVDTRTLYNNPGNIDSNVAGVLRDQLNQINMKYHLNFPGRLVYHNGDVANDREVIWQIRMNDVNYMIAEVRFPLENEIATFLDIRFIWIALGAIFVVSTGFLVASVWVRPSIRQTGRKL